MMSSLKLRSMKQLAAEESAKSRLPTPAEEWAVTLATLWFFVGLFTDGWAHNHLPELESFFTPWHAVFYSGYGVSALTLLYSAYRNAKQSDLSFRQGIPQGYGFAVLGVPLFALGGVGDMLWHEIFGIEADVEALLSPTHLILATSMFLIVSANLCAWFKRTPPLGKPKLLSQIPMSLSAGMSVALMMFMTQFSHFTTIRAGVGDAARSGLHQSLAISGYLLQAAVLSGIYFLLLKRGRIAPGVLTILLVVTLLPMAIMRDGLHIVPLCLLAGVLADVLAQRMHPFDAHRTRVRTFAFVVPATLMLAYFIGVHMSGGIGWSVHLWTGSIVMSGLAGLLSSFLVLPPEDWRDQ